MKIKKLVIFLFINVLFICSIMSPLLASEHIFTNVERINALYSNNIYSDEVNAISGSVHSEPHYYDNDTKAKLYILLAQRASLKGSYTKAIELATQGLTLTALETELKLTLILALADSYYANGQYKETLQISNQAILLAKNFTDLAYRLTALCYRSIAYSLVDEHKLALLDLQNVERLIDSKPIFANNILLLDALALAHFHLGHYTSTVQLQNQIITMKAKALSAYNLERSYYNLALAYTELEKNDDAYNAFWEAEKVAKQHSLIHRLGYIQLGIGDALLQKGSSEEAYRHLNKAKNYFVNKNKPDPYLKSLALLAKAAKETSRNEESEHLLLAAEQLAQQLTVKDSEIEVYYQLYALYKEKDNYKRAIEYLATYMERFQAALKTSNEQLFLEKLEYSYRPQIEHSSSRIVESNHDDEELNQKVYLQQQLINLLSALCIILFLLAVILWLRKRTFQLTTEYNDNEKPVDFLCSPGQTKYLYQLNYKKARKFNYPISIGYIMVTNWSELNVRVNKRVVDEICRTIARLINEAVSEYDYVGKLNDGQYLMLCPYQSSDEIALKLKSITDSLSIRSFANVGDFSINIGYSYETPSVQDIDPYIFLSRLSERVSAKYTN